MEDYNAFCNEYPMQETIINGQKFQYRYYNNKNAKSTIVLLVGGLGLSDLIYTHFQKFSQNFSVMTFDYPIGYKTNEELAEGIYGLLISLNIKAWFIGQSLGGFVGQLIAEKYPQVTEGLVLSNTGCTSDELSEVARNSLLNMIESSKKSKKIVKCIPFSLFKKLLRRKIFKNHAKQFSNDEKIMLGSVCDIVDEKLVKAYELHMINLLMDLREHMGMKKDSFKYLNDKVLLILSEDDKTFHSEVKSSLVDMMPSPTVITDLKGGHLALMVNCDEYIKLITDYILQRTEIK